MAVETLIVRAPGRVNLIGEHTDYNEGFVMPIAIDRCTTVRAQRSADGRVRVRSTGFEPTADFSLRGDAAPATEGWARYVHGVIQVLQSAGYRLAGADLAIESTVPVGAGLSSSAALEVACASALLRCARIEVDLTTLARLCQRAENEYAGAQCGIMDQYVACHARTGHALLLDCRSLTHRHLSTTFHDAPAVFVVCNSMVRHALANSEYNQRRAQCEVGVRALAMRDPAVHSLRDVTGAQLESLGSGMNELIKRRCRHVIAENERVVAAATALSRGSAATLGALMSASHRSLRDDYEVSCSEIDLLVDIASRVEGVLGARMTGGGFGGCTVNLVRTDAVERFVAQVSTAYASATGLQPQMFICAPSQGVTSSVEAG